MCFRGNFCVDLDSIVSMSNIGGGIAANNFWGGWLLCNMGQNKKRERMGDPFSLFKWSSLGMKSTLYDYLCGNLIVKNSIAPQGGKVNTHFSLLSEKRQLFFRK